MKTKILEVIKRAAFLPIIGVSIFASGSFSTVAYAQSEHEKWGESGNWTILIDPDAGDRCYMESVVDGETLVQMGIAPDRNGGFFAAYNANWTDMVEGEVRTLRFDFEASLFGGEYIVAKYNGLPGGYVFFNNPDFVKEFGKRNSVVVQDENAGALTFKLTGTMKAINAVRNCDAEQSR